MDWIERILGVSPDGGSGTLELLFFVMPIVSLIYLVRLARRKRAGWHERKR
jgi:hypothetical protein